MGGIANAINQQNIGGLGAASGGAAAGAGSQANLEAKVERLTKLVHILWKEAERLESIVKVIPEGLQIKTGFSEVTVLKNGGIIISGLRVFVKGATENELYT